MVEVRAKSGPPGYLGLSPRSTVRGLRGVLPQKNALLRSQLIPKLSMDCTK
jgi:hypothetical protein